jgi:hypothetical protein
MKVLFNEVLAVDVMLNIFFNSSDLLNLEGDNP